MKFCRRLLISLMGLVAALFLSGKTNTLTVQTEDSLVRKSIYPEDRGHKRSFYNYLWGKHYRSLYCIPVEVPVVSLERFRGGVRTVQEVPNYQALILKDSVDNLYLMKLLGGSTSFWQSAFFRDSYNRKDFQGTYLNTFIGDAYTMIHPYTFLASEYMAGKAGLNTTRPKIYAVGENERPDTTASRWDWKNRLVMISDLPDLNADIQILSTEEMLEKVKASPRWQVNQAQYIRSRLFDMLIGDWNKVPENWAWEASAEGDGVLFNPIVIDRNHAFTKVDGLLYQQLLNTLGLSFIVNYEAEVKTLIRRNALGFPLDMALVGGCDESVWQKEATFLQQKLTDEVIEQAFSLLPPEIIKEDIGLLRDKLKRRRELLPEMARRYVLELKKRPVIAATRENDSIVVTRMPGNEVRVRIYSTDDGKPYYDNLFGKDGTREIWIYGVGGDDRFVVAGESEKPIPVYLISGKGENDYQLEGDKKLRVYGTPSEKEALEAYPRVWSYLTDSVNIHRYDYEKLKYHTTQFSPVGVYDSDNGTSMALYYTFTMYAFKRSPYTYRHRVGYNFSRGFYYQGFFPGYNSRLGWVVDLFVGNPKNFNNFFGFGNETPDYKDETDDYNRVYVKEYSLTPSFHYALTPESRLTVALGVEGRKTSTKKNRFILDYYGEDYRIFKTNYYTDLKATVETTRHPSVLIPRVGTSLAAGWKLNLSDLKMNVPYAEAKLAVDVRFTDRFTFATQFVAKALFSNSYEFFQSASTELRGYRDNRFIGKQAFYQYSDLRLDMGRLENPFTPIKYGFFAGFDHGRVWYPGESSRQWHVSYGGGFWLTFLNKLTTKYSYFNSSDTFRFSLGLNLDF